MSAIASNQGQLSVRKSIILLPQLDQTRGLLIDQPRQASNTPSPRFAPFEVMNDSQSIDRLAEKTDEVSP
jgi:hypothetical protein